jgi:hypothetical protein
MNVLQIVKAVLLATRPGLCFMAVLFQPSQTDPY